MMRLYRRALLVLMVVGTLALAACGGTQAADDGSVPIGTPVLEAPEKATDTDRLEEKTLSSQQVAPSGATPVSGLPGGALPVPSGAMPDPLPPVNAVHGTPAAIWQPLLQRLAADGISGPQVTALFAALPDVATQSPMGRKMKELYRRRFLPAPPTSGKPRQQYYKGVVTEANARICADFVKENAAAFTEAQRRYGVPRHVAVALLFVETRLGRVLGDVKENAFYTLASMAVSREPDSIRQWLPQLPGYEKHLDWLRETMPQRADWAYKETRALVEHMLRDQVPAEHLPGSIYGAVGLCQFMPSNITSYGADGDGDGRVDLFTIPDAVASLSCYLYKHGWRAGIDRKRQHALLMRYNKSTVYANTILALGDLVAKQL
ncbi:lytic murein transglycosylase [uncultured Desulfovibrio sp.]|uniref:lytic murein transglycosylase n=1 Tax=uncultured Desulfovibrio sp. TaxID=167968 RepID=UPI002634B388|nr:lytic murein transglycosylase [uncultured Desulfovibrio sp.]